MEEQGILGHVADASYRLFHPDVHALHRTVVVPASKVDPNQQVSFLYSLMKKYIPTKLTLGLDLTQCR
jgi:hypothetical protein